MVKCLLITGLLVCYCVTMARCDHNDRQEGSPCKSRAPQNPIEGEAIKESSDCDKPTGDKPNVPALIIGCGMLLLNLVACLGGAAVMRSRAIRAAEVSAKAEASGVPPSSSLPDFACVLPSGEITLALDESKIPPGALERADEGVPATASEPQITITIVDPSAAERPGRAPPQPSRSASV
mmetsp:Transcript_7539/g.25626  ORF Transcript_7539/g.25626 Transcript_7539/m.25626 type:complete len:180 (-) Transcript_7539:563-1102(-)